MLGVLLQTEKLHMERKYRGEHWSGEQWSGEHWSSAHAEKNDEDIRRHCKKVQTDGEVQERCDKEQSGKSLTDSRALKSHYSKRKSKNSLESLLQEKYDEEKSLDL